MFSERKWFKLRNQLQHKNTQPFLEPGWFTCFQSVHESGPAVLLFFTRNLKTSCWESPILLCFSISVSRSPMHFFALGACSVLPHFGLRYGKLRFCFRHFLCRLAASSPNNFSVDRICTSGDACAHQTREPLFQRVEEFDSGTFTTATHADQQSTNRCRREVGQCRDDLSSCQVLSLEPDTQM